jgi:hypothetical protein
VQNFVNLFDNGQIKTEKTMRKQHKVGLMEIGFETGRRM